MKPRWIATLIAVTMALSLTVAWLSGLFIGEPLSETSDQTGSSRTFWAKETQTMGAITNAFRLFRYHEMMLSDAVGTDYLAPDWHPTNGLILLPTTSIIAKVPSKGFFGTRQLAYVASFHITATAVDSNRTRVTVRTVTSKVMDGLAVGHGGVTPNLFSVKPVTREEQNVLDAIQAELPPVQKPM
jgi:hypothetical protein